MHPGSLDFGVSPTHTKIHAGDLILDWGARKDFKQHNKRGFAEFKSRGEKEVHDQMLKLLSIRVNEPRAGGSGSSNTGNIGWALVANASKIAPKIFLEVDVPHDVAKEIIECLGYFLIAVNSKFVLHTEKFERLCDHLDRLMIQWIEWHPSVPSIHLGIVMKLGHKRWFRVS